MAKPSNLTVALRDRILRHEIYLKKLEAATVRRVLGLLAEAERDVVRQIETRLAWIAERGFDASPFTMKRLSLNLAEIQGAMRAAYREVGTVLRRDLKELAEYEAEWSAQVLGKSLKGVGLDVGVGIAGGEMLRHIVDTEPLQGALLKDWSRSLSDNQFRRVSMAVRQGMLQGESIGDVVRRVRGRATGKRHTYELGGKMHTYVEFKGGVLDIGTRQAESLVRTAISHVANGAREATWRENDDLIDAIQWVSTLDARTTPECMIRDGLLYDLDYEPIGHSIPWEDGPGALHWGCRSTSVPVLKTWRELGIPANELTGEMRAALDGFVPAGERFGEWIARQDPSVMADALGPVRAEALRDGSLSFGDLFSRKGEWLTLDQLRLKDAA